MEVDFSYDVKEQQPFVHLDHIGYENKDQKLVFFSGKDLDTNFELRDAKTENILYKGKMQKIRSGKDCDLYMGNFTECQENGNYYIYNSTIGDSKEFEISEELYSTLFEYYFSIFQSRTEQSISCKVYSLSNLLFAKELFPNAAIDDLFFKEEMQKLYGKLENGKAMSNREKAEVAALLAQYSSVYGNRDLVFSGECLKLASATYIYLVGEDADLPIEIWKLLASQMYKASGQYQYRNKISELDALLPTENKKILQDYSLLTDFAYISTDYPTDYHRCKAILDYYLEWAQQISENSLKENFYVLSNADSLNTTELLDHLMILGFVNYVLSGREYEVVQKNYVHYYLGGNQDNKNHLMNKEVLEQMECEEFAKLLFIISSLC